MICLNYLSLHIFTLVVVAALLVEGRYELRHPCMDGGDGLQYGSVWVSDPCKKATFSNATKHCKEMGMDLVEITNDAIFHEVFDALKNVTRSERSYSDPGTDPFWVGAMYDNDIGAHRWIVSGIIVNMAYMSSDRCRERELYAYVGSRSGQMGLCYGWKEGEINPEFSYVCSRVKKMEQGN